jgi:Undecaprenyl-phosphate galactose phosphotransferase WbaP
VNPPIATIALLVVADISSIVSSLLLASAIRDHFFAIPGAPISGIILPALVLTLASFIAVGLYPGVSINPVDEMRLSTLSISIAFLVLWSATFFLHDISLSRLVYILAFVLSLVFVPVFRAVIRAALCRKSWWGSQVVILGYGTTGKILYDKLTKNPALGLKPYAVLDDDPEQTCRLEATLLKGPLSRCLEITAKHKISYGIVCMPGLSRHQLLDLIERYGRCFGHILVIPNLIGMTSLGITAKDVDGIIGLEVKQQLLRPSSRYVKRLLDLSLTLALAPIIIPILAFFALLIKLEDGGTVFYSNERMGFRGRKFKAWKLRSMVANGDAVLWKHFEANPADRDQWLATQKLKRDPRLTAVGRFIRKTSIDEIPQFWNVLRGEMSIVGPRPVLEGQVNIYGPSYALYQEVRPGITGLWQVSGRNHLTFAERVALDKYVIQNWSVWLDLYILARTAGAVLTGDGAY